MAGARAAIRYAKAVLASVSNEKEAQTVNENMKLIANTIAGNREFSSVIQSPVINAAAKKAILDEVFKKADKLTISLIDTLIDNNRIAILHQVASKFTELYDQSKGIAHATVTTAVAISPELEKQVLAKAKAMTGKDVDLKNKVDESIIGGFILRIGDVQYNASIINQLNNLKREFTLN